MFLLNLLAIVGFIYGVVAIVFSFLDIKDLGYVKTGKKYEVSDNAIRKWIKNM